MKQNNNELSLFSLTTRGLGEEFFKKFNLNNCNDIDKFKTSLLQNAISDEKYNIAKFLIEKKCNINNQDERGYTALDYLLSSKNEKNIELINLLLDASPNLELEDFEYGNQPLWTAVMNAKVPLPTTKRLLEMRADPHHKNKAGRSPYDMIKEYNISEINEIFEPYI